MYLRPPNFIKRFFPSLVWSIKSNNSIYLTFDDGPTPEVTEWVLAELDKYNAKATFFCIGKNAELHGELLDKIRANGHAIGNHSYSHNKGWQMGCERYVEDIDLANEHLKSNLFRPPYGRVTRSQIRRLSTRYHLIMWDILSRDYSKVVSPERCEKEVLPHLKTGSIVVFHDSVKASKNLYHTLPLTLKRIYELGLKCEAIKL